MKLKRVAYGPLTLQGLTRGQQRRLSTQEVNALRKLVGLAA